MCGMISSLIFAPHKGFPINNQPPLPPLACWEGWRLGGLLDLVCRLIQWATTPTLCRHHLRARSLPVDSDQWSARLAEPTTTIIKPLYLIRRFNWTTLGERAEVKMALVISAAERQTKKQTKKQTDHMEEHVDKSIERLKMTTFILCKALIFCL